MALLQQVLADLPIIQERSKVTQAWSALASVLVGADCFSRAKRSGRNAQSRVNQLPQARRFHNTNAMSLSGVDEDVSEKNVLLDALIELLDDAEDAQEQKKCADEERKDRDDAGSLLVSRLAMERSDSDSSSSNNKRKSRSRRTQWCQ